MSIPALDSVNASKVGLVQQDERTIVCELHDNGVEGTHGGLSDHWKRAHGFLVKNTQDVDGIVPEVVMTNPDPDDLVDFSDDFVDIVADIHDAVTSESEEERDIEYDRVDGDEKKIIQYLVMLLNSDHLPESIWHNVVWECHRRSRRDHDMEIVENSERPFSDSEFIGTNYIPEDDFIEDMRVVANEQEFDYGTVASLWFQYEDSSGDWTEVPLAFETNGRFIAYDYTLDYGEDAEPLSDAFTDALRNAVDGTRGTDDGLSSGESCLLDALTAVDLNGTHTKRVLTEYL